MLDLDKLRAEREAARREQKQEAPEFTFKGKTFKVPVELPLDLMWDLEEGLRGREFAKRLLSDGPFDELIALEPSRDDWANLDRWLGELYLSREKSTAGESQASDAS
jgi:hypothetical protein